MSEEASSTEVPPMEKKTKRKRLKHLCKQIRQQMEFYFSDANFHKDRFLKRETERAEDGYVPLDVFLRFNKIQALTADLDLIRKALSSSTALQVNESGDKVKRTTPYTEPKDVDERTIYVECLPPDVNHSWLQELFQDYGSVVYTSLPRYKTTGDLKGFAFIEFATAESAEKACQSLQQPEESATGHFPKSNHQLKNLLQKQNKAKDPDQPAESQQKGVSPAKRGKRRRLNTSESSGDEAGLSRTQDEATKESPCKQLRTVSDDPEAEPAADEGEKVEEVTKRKRSLDVESEAANKRDSSSEKNGESKDQDKENTNVKDEEKSEKGEIEATDECLSDNTQTSSQATTVTATEMSSVVKRKRSLPCDPEAKESKRVRINEEVQVKVAAPLKKRRHRAHHKKLPNKQEKPQLRVIPKLEWLQLRADYLQRQKTSMQELKKALQLNKQERQATETITDKPQGKAKKTMDFTANVIVKVSCDKPSNKKDIKDLAGLVADVAYVDLTDGETEGLVRCKDAEGASKLTAAVHKGLQYVLLQGEEEKTYWDKIFADRDRKLNSKSNVKKRGSTKLLERAEKVNMETLQKKHVYFD